jgi:hypothetical protein
MRHGWPRSAWVLALLLLLVPGRAVPQVAAVIPTGAGWQELPATQLRAVCPPNGFGGSDYGFSDKCHNVIEAWNSAILDTRRNRLVLWGGGHADYLGNDLYAVELAAHTVRRLTDPGLPVVRGACAETLVNGSQPNSRHTYDALVYMEHVDRMFVFGGSLSECGSFSNATWTFNFTSMTWERRNPAGPIPRPDPGVVSAYDPTTGKVFLHDSSYFYSYDFGTDRYERLSSFNGIDYHMTAVIDPVRRKFFVVGAGYVYAYDLGRHGLFFGRQTLDTKGGEPIVKSVYPGLAYNPTTGTILAWNGGDTVYSLNVDTKTWTPITYSGGPGEAPRNGTFKRWSYSPTSGVFVVANRMNQNVYVFRLTPGSGAAETPPSLPTGR